ncbi:MAG TPA: TetR family transcriptional regulator [Pseudonocardiaceae bacterium]|nr:TetR family transcriptional regulator [Pseudonocardiaceae bacterium]
MAKDVPSTRDRLLAAARAEFAAHGIAGARTDRIARLAGVNKERIYGYFGSKEKLFDAVVMAAMDEMVDAVPLSSDDDPAEYVGRVFDFHRDHPDLLRLLLWEGLHYREQPLPNDDERARRYREKVSTLAGALGVDSSFDVAACLLTLIGLAAWPSAAPQLARLILGDAVDEPARRNAMRRYVTDFAARALAEPDSKWDPVAGY